MDELIAKAARLHELMEAINANDGDPQKFPEALELVGALEQDLHETKMRLAQKQEALSEFLNLGY